MVEVNDGEPAPVAETSEDELDKFEEPILKESLEGGSRIFCSPRGNKNTGCAQFASFFSSSACS